MNRYGLWMGALLSASALPLTSLASSHREAPFIAGMPRVDGSDFYMFRSYEPGRADYVTLIANYTPLQDSYGGPNYFSLDSTALYQIHVDNNGDAKPDLTFRFRFTNTYKNLSVNANGKNVAVPLLNIGPVYASGRNLNLTQSYVLELVSGDPNTGTAQAIGNATLGGSTFYKPVDNIGKKSIPNYAAYAAHFVYDISIPGCAQSGRVFVGQRKDGFVVNLGEVFDLVNTNPAGPRDAEPNTIADKNVTSIALEIPKVCLVRSNDPVIGAWTTASLPQDKGTWTQVSRLGMPLVNELIIGLPDKNKFNASPPSGDAQFINYVTNPTLPVLLNTLFGPAAQVPQSPRNDLVTTFLTGIKGLNQPVKITPAEMLRLNTSVAATPPRSQSDLGVLAGDNAGYPNGRRPYDDVVDISLRVAMGALCGAVGSCGAQTSDPNKGIPYTDGARAAGPDAVNSQVTGAVSAADTYLFNFPYLQVPIPGSPNGIAD